MTKSQKIKEIIKIQDFFQDAKNHGNSNNWWYPTPCTVAYNVKMHSFADVDTLRGYMMPLQNEYYNDDTLTNIIYEQQNDTAGQLEDDVTQIAKNAQIDVTTGYAGRSGGWLEVNYSNAFSTVYDESELYNESEKDIDILYSWYSKLDKLESDIAEFIKNEHTAYNGWIDTPKYYEWMAEEVLTTEDEIVAMKQMEVDTLKQKYNLK